jgi:hypothetical protein
MQVERDIIVKKVFPRFRIESEKRGISFSYVDLRWGVKPNARPKEIIDICLSEIKNCEPFFIGLIGHNYGSIIPNLENTEITQLEKNHEGVDKLIQKGPVKKIGYTELEMRYNLLYSKDKSRNFFYIRDDNSANKGCLFSVIPQIGNWNKCFSLEKSLEKLKEFVWANYFETTSVYPDNTTFKESQDLEDIVYNDLMSIIQDIQIPSFPQETFIRNIQEFFLEKQKRLIPRNFVEEVENWVNQDIISKNDNTEILLLKGDLGSGRTSVLAEYLNQQHTDFYVLYHFVGVSLQQETPELILKDFIFQICTCLEIKEPIYSQEETKEDLCLYLTQYLQKSDKKSVIVIDDIEEIECDTDSLMSIISWLPTKVKNLKYVFSLSNKRILFQHCPEWINNTELILYDLSPSDCYDFSKTYLLQRYKKDITGEYGKDKVELLTLDFFNNKEKSFLRKIGLLKLFLDEIAMLDFGNDTSGGDLVKMINEKSKNKSTLLELPFARIEDEIFMEDWGKARIILSYLSLIDYGIYENDIIEVCSDQQNEITQVDWSKLYSHIKPFIVSEGYIKLSPEIRSLIIDQYFKYDKKTTLCNKRKSLAERLEQLNTHNNYTIEIISQYLKAENYEELKRFLSSPLIINYTFRHQEDLLFESLKALKARNHVDDFADNLMVSVNCLDGTIQLHSYEVISDIFSNTLPVYDVALNAINKAIEILESINSRTDHENRELADDYLKRTRLLTTLYSFESAYKSIEDYFQLLSKDKAMLGNDSMYVQGLIAKANIYTHNPSTKEKLKAIPICQEAINKNDKKDEIGYISLLYNYAGLCGYYCHNKDEVSRIKDLISSFITDSFVFGTISYFKALIELRDTEYTELQLLSNNIEDYLNYCKELTEDFRKYIEIYSRITRDTAGFYMLIETVYYRIASMYYKINNYTEFVVNIDNAAYYCDLYKNAIDAIFPNYTKLYADALHEVAKVYQSFIETRPSEKEVIIHKCLICYSQEERILKELFPEGHWDLAKAYHNVADIYKEKNEFDTAKEFIEKAIQMKRKFIDINEKSLHNSYIRKLIIYKKEIVEKEIHDVEFLDEYQEQITELLAFTKDNLDLSEQEKDSRIQEIMNYQTWLDNWRNNSKDCYYDHSKDILEIAKKMIRDFQVRMNSNNEDVLRLSLLLYLQWEKLNSYIAKHHLQEEFDKNEEYNNFKPLINLIEKLNYQRT